MEKMALIVKMAAKDGKRDEVRDLWMERIKPVAEKNENIDFCCYVYDTQDNNTIYMFEYLNKPEDFDNALQADWLVKYNQAMAPLLTSPPVVVRGKPMYVKGIA